MRGLWRWGRVLTVMVLLFIGYQMVLFCFVLTSLDSNSLDPDPATAPGEATGHLLHVGTYNIWNYNSHWEIRKIRIAEVIRESQLDIVGLQEVRNVTALGGHQLDHLKELLPDYPYSVFHSAHQAKRQGASDIRVHEPEEGVAILSKHPIIYSQSFLLPNNQNDEDQNVRVLLLAHINVPHFGVIYFFVTHLSFAHKIQCRHVYELLRIVRTLDLDPSRPKIIVGDFNLFPVFEDPAAFFDRPSSEVSQDNKCWEVVRDEQLDWNAAPVRSSTDLFHDVWSLLRPGDYGFTFSNLPFAEHTHTWPAVSTRPDRIYISGLVTSDDDGMKGEHSLVPRRIVRREDGTQYRRKFYWPLLRRRVRYLINTINGVDNSNPYFTYARLYEELYQPLVETLQMEQESDTDNTAEQQEEEAPDIVQSKSNKIHRIKKAQSLITPPAKRGTILGTLQRKCREYSRYLFGFDVQRLSTYLLFHLPFYLFSAVPTALSISVAILCCLCRSQCYRQVWSRCSRRICHLCGCPRRHRCILCPCCRSSAQTDDQLPYPNRSTPKERRHRWRSWLASVACCAALILPIIVAIASSICVFFAPIVLTDYIDDMVPSDHRLVVATLQFP